MLIVNDTSLRWASEIRVAEWLRAPTLGGRSRPGVAIADCHVPTKGGTWTQQVDFVVFTPWAVVVLEVKGIHPDIVGGHLIAEANDLWRHSDSDLEPVHTRARDTNPLDQARTAALRLKSFTAVHNPDHGFVHAAVVLVAPDHCALTLKAGPMPHGTAVTLGDTALHRLLDDISDPARTPIWTAEQVYSTLNALSLGRLVTIGDLIAEGFPPLDPAAAPPTSLRPPTGAVPRPAPPAPDRAEPAPAPPAPSFRPAPHRTPPSPASRAPAATEPYRRRNRRRRRRIEQALAAALILTILIAIYVLITHFEHAAPVPGHDQPPPSTQHELHAPAAPFTP